MNTGVLSDHSLPPLPGPARSLRGLKVAAHVAKSLFVPTGASRISDRTSRKNFDPLSLWCRDLLELLGIDVAVEGRLPESGPFLLVANHISWIDILLIRSLFPARFIAKEEIALWPMVGAGARRAGTLFIARGRLSSLRTIIEQVSQNLEDGAPVAFFPEGTTTTGDRLLPFKSGIFESSVRTGVPVLPLAIRYENAPGSPTRSIAYTGGESFGASFWRTLGERRITARIVLCPPVHPEELSRKELAARSRELLSEALSPSLGGNF